LFRSVVVVRGKTPMPPRDLIPFFMPKPPLRRTPRHGRLSRLTDDEETAPAGFHGAFTDAMRKTGLGQVAPGEVPTGSRF
jgi:hypothetical protein